MYSPTAYITTAATSSKAKSGSGSSKIRKSPSKGSSGGSSSSSSSGGGGKLSTGGIIAIVVVCIFFFCVCPIGYIVYETYAERRRTVPTPAVVMVEPTLQPYYGNASTTVVPYGEPHFQQPIMGRPQIEPYGVMPNILDQPAYAFKYGQPPGQQMGPYGLQEVPPGQQMGLSYQQVHSAQEDHGLESPNMN